VVWTKPDELAYDPKQPLPKLGVYKDGAHLLMGDGSVWRLLPQATEKGIRGAIEHSDGNAIPEQHLRRIPWRGPALHLEFRRGPAPQAPAALDRDDLAKLQGDWVVRVAELNEKPLTPKEIDELHLALRDGQFEFHRNGKYIARQAGSFRIETGKRQLLLYYKGQTVPVRCNYRIDGDRLHLDFAGLLATDAQAGNTGELFRTAEQLHSRNNLKQLAAALLSYQDAYKGLPQAAIAKDGKPLLSWRVAILPYMEQDELYKTPNTTRNSSTRCPKRSRHPASRRRNRA
jgi:hypothetical protein